MCGQQCVIVVHAGAHTSHLTAVPDHRTPDIDCPSVIGGMSAMMHIANDGMQCDSATTGAVPHL